MAAFVDKVKVLQDELMRLRRERGEYLSGVKSIESDYSTGLTARLPDIIADIDRQIVNITSEIVKLGGPVI